MCVAASASPFANHRAASTSWTANAAALRYRVHMTQRSGAVALVVGTLALACRGDAGTAATDSGTASADGSGTSIAATTTLGAADGTSTGGEPYTWPDEDLLAEVDPFIGSGGVGYRVGTINPGAVVPFGMIEPGPDTGLAGLQISFLNCTGYHHDQTHVWGFSHSRIDGMGVPDYGAILVTPTVGMDATKAERGGARSTFSHEQESARPGHYAVTLLDPGIDVELTATTHVALHRYAWSDPAADAVVVLDLGYGPGGMMSPASSIAIDREAGTLTGTSTVMGGYSDRFGGVPTYFAARVSPPPARAGTWDDAGVLHEDETTADGAQIGAWLGFDLGDDATVEIALAISYVSVEQAQANLAAEAPTTDFAGTRADAEAAWQTELARVRVAGGSDDERRMFYTALYHAFLSPTTFSEVDGVYRGFDDAIHQTDRTYYSDFSLWDTYRTLHPLFDLVQRDRQADMMQSLATMYEQGGDLPMWPLAFGYTGGMVGTPADIVLADAYLADITDFDVEAAYEGARLHATEARPNDGRPDVAGYIDRGWVAADNVLASVSNTMEFAIADHAIGRWAAAMGNDADAAVFGERAHAWANHFDPATGFLIGRRADGSFVTDGFTSDEWLDVYAEGTAWHYLWMVPHDAARLAELLGGEVAARERLADYFAMSADFLAGPEYNPNMPVPYYWQANEPSLHDAYLFTEWGDPASTQRWVDWARRRHYGTGADGLPGNDDAGTMSAWYVWSAIGLYPVTGQARWWITAPVFERIELDMSDADAPDRRLTIVAEGAGAEMIYVAGARWNDEVLVGPTITWSQLRAGGTLALDLADAPTDFGAR